MCLCVCVCVCVCVCIHMYKYTYIYTYINTHICMYTHTHTHTHTHTGRYHEAWALDQQSHFPSLQLWAKGTNYDPKKKSPLYRKSGYQDEARSTSTYKGAGGGVGAPQSRAFAYMGLLQTDFQASILKRPLFVFLTYMGRFQTDFQASILKRPL